MLKRLVFIFVVSSIIASGLFCSQKTNIVNAVGKSDATVHIYCKQYNGLNVANGAGVVKTTVANFYKCLQNAIGVDGVTVVMDKNSIDVVTLV